MDTFGKYLIKEYGGWILYLSWIASIVFFSVIVMMNIELWFLFVIDLIGGTLIAIIFIIFSIYKEYKDKIYGV